jgi:hypothetical protein
MTVFQWLQSDIGSGKRTIDHFADLVFRNHGRMAIHPGSKTCLKNLNEILELNGMVGCFDGFMKACDGKDWQEAIKLIEDECQRLAEAERKAMSTEDRVHALLRR